MAVTGQFLVAADNSHLHALRHYSAMELFTAAVDLRTIAGWLGHGSEGATIRRVHAAWVDESDRDQRDRRPGINPSGQVQPPATQG
jgi:integrase